MKKLILLLVILILILAASIWGASRVWLNSEDVELGFHGYTCLLYTSDAADE